ARADRQGRREALAGRGEALPIARAQCRAGAEDPGAPAAPDPDQGSEPAPIDAAAAGGDEEDLAARDGAGAPELQVLPGRRDEEPRADDRDAEADPHGGDDGGGLG